MNSGQNLDSLTQLEGELRQRVIDELKRPTHIAVIGKSGVGKTSTINALFGFHGKVSHVNAGTTSIEDYIYETERGRLRVTDMPGLGEDIETEDRYREMYARTLQQCEVALFVLRADSRDMRDVQLIFRDLIKASMPDAANRIVIGINQVDLAHPGDWIVDANLPSRQQEKTIGAIKKARLESIRKVYRIDSERIVPYSATKRYKLENLFHALLLGTAGEAWILSAKKSIANWKDLVDPRYLPGESTKR